MLSKQLWRILSRPNSLLSSVLLARYFPDGQVLNTSVGRNPSYTWRSIWATQHIVKGGFRWCIGSGQSVSMWKDPWLPRPFSFRALSPQASHLSNMKVCDLIDSNTKDWNYPLVRELFWPKRKTSSTLFFAALLPDRRTPDLCPQLYSFVSPGECDPYQHSQSNCPPRWTLPDTGWIKINYDGAIFAAETEVGMGVIARDANGTCVGWRTIREKRQMEPEPVEALAAHEAVSLARRMGWRKIILEGDCANLHLKLSSPQEDCSTIGTIVRDIKFYATDYEDCVFSLVRRTGNRVAHSLARNATAIETGDPIFPPSSLILLLSDIDI
ncbi:UNVERIFIED_CONTAM: hypothetical protein Sangu_2796900 [Sesamum angustifolium]|uniref:RNase H type-1 domain-containing protein n=1 Tax=Sesamum angustifolium TaxID=2727405 RepID=A0AAW2IS83_9LAMI